MTATLQPRPTVGAPTLWRFPQIEDVRLDNGVRLLSVHLPGKHVATTSVLLDVPVDADPSGQEGLAVIAARCLDEGTTSLTATAFADALELQGASFRAVAGYDGITATLDVPVSRLGTALPLLADAVLNPVFPESEVDRVIAQRLAEIVQEQSNPPSRAGVELPKLLHIAGTRHTIHAAGTETSLGQLSAPVVAEAYRGRISPTTTTVIVTGDLSGVDVPALVAAAFGSWQGSGEPWAPTLPAYDGRRRALVVDRAGSAQTQLVLGHSAPDRSAPAWSAMGLAAYALGGTLTSRIDAVLREEKGYTYGMRGAFAPQRRGGAFLINGSVDTGNTAPALADLMTVLTTALEDGLRDDEHVAAREYLVGVSPMRWETPGAVASQLGAVVGNDLPLSWIDSYLDGLRTATLDDINAAMRSHVHPSELLVVAVGEAAAITGPLADLGWTDVEVVSA